jgi:hypothetical protein
VDGEAIEGKNCDTQSSFRVSDRSKGSPMPMGPEISKDSTFSWLHQWDKYKCRIWKHSLFGPSPSPMFTIKIKTLYFWKQISPILTQKRKSYSVGLPNQNHVCEQPACIQCCKNCTSDSSMQK